MAKKLLTILLAILIVAVISTAVYFIFPYEPKQPPKADDNGSTQLNVQNLVDSNNKFAFDIYSELDKTNNGNLFYSPYSLFAAMAIAYEGSKSQTYEEIKSVLHFPETDILRPNFANIYNSINEKNDFYELRTGNALWLQYDYPLLEDYKTRVEQYYGSKAQNLDFIQETEKSRQTINSFIEEQTNNKIKDLLPPNSVDSSTKLVITNAVYFKGKWEWEFKESSTQELDFKITPSNIIKTPMMSMHPEKARFNYADLDKFQILELPYKGEKISMLVLLPKQGEEYNFETEKTTTYNYNLEDIELSSEKLKEYKSKMKETMMDSILLPKFEFDTKYFMKDNFKALGMSSAFSDSADFSAMNTAKNLKIDEVIHQAYINVDEQGTEAAAATAIIMKVTSAMPTNIFRADHPFIFIIQEKQTGNILFIGRLTDPRK